MALERTFSIIKPDAVAKNAIGQIVGRFEANGLQIVAQRMEHLTEEKAKGFYAEHDGKGFFNDLVAFMTSGPVVLQVLEDKNASSNSASWHWHPPMLHRRPRTSRENTSPTPRHTNNEKPKHSSRARRTATS